MSTTTTTTPTRYVWATRGDINAFFGLVLDNISCMILMAGLLVGFGFPADFVLGRMVPGTAIGVMVGDLIYTGMAFELARRQNRVNVTAMPLGLDTPSTFGMVFLVLRPAFEHGRTALGLDAEAAARHAWFLGIAMLLASGFFKLACAPFCGWVRRAVPRAGLLGSLAAIALVLISFLPLLDIAAAPVAGMVATAVILATLTARWRLPRDFPGALGALIVGGGVYYAMNWLGFGGEPGPSVPRVWQVAVPLPLHDWLAWFETSWREALSYLPVALPLALATVIGGIDCAESAAAAGDDYHTGPIIAVEGFATLVGGCFGGVIQSTPYIGHPAYKAMGARAAYTLATALFVGGAGVFGYFGWIFAIVPKAVVLPILIFVGLEITAQSFHATPRRHYTAAALACVPALAYLAKLNLDQLLPPTAAAFEALRPDVQHWVQTVTVLAGGGGFIVTSLLWATFLAKLIDGRMRSAAFVAILAAACALFGVIHSPLPGSPVMLPHEAIAQLKAAGRYEAAAGQTPYHWAAAYAAMAAAVLLIGRFGHAPNPDEAEAAEPHPV